MKKNVYAHLRPLYIFIGGIVETLCSCLYAAYLDQRWYFLPYEYMLKR